MGDPVTLHPQSAFEPHLKSIESRSGAGVVVCDRADLQIATVTALSGRDALAELVRSAYGLELPDGPHRVASRELAFVGIGPCTWLITRDGGKSLADDLRHDLGPAAAVADQSSGYAVLRLSGDEVRATFEKGFGIDLHPRAFCPGHAAATSCGHIGVIIWQVDDAPSYEIAVFRSLAASFWHWLSESAAMFGLKVEARPT